ncbi:MAG: hypothetical protein ABIS20_24320, partial [Thermoanaerobaculia bacterium]
ARISGGKFSLQSGVRVPEFRIRSQAVTKPERLVPFCTIETDNVQQMRSRLSAPKDQVTGYASPVRVFVAEGFELSGERTSISRLTCPDEYIQDRFRNESGHTCTAVVFDRQSQGAERFGNPLSFDHEECRPPGIGVDKTHSLGF